MCPFTFESTPQYMSEGFFSVNHPRVEPTTADDSSTLSFVEQVIRHSTKIDVGGIVSQPPPMSDFSPAHHCFLCSAWFQTEDELSEHLGQHADLAKSGDKLDITFMDDLEASLLEKPVDTDRLILPSPSNAQAAKKVSSSPSWQ